MTIRLLIASLFVSMLAGEQAPGAKSLPSPCELVAEIDGAQCDVVEFYIGGVAAPVLRLRFASDKAERDAIMIAGKAVTDWCIKSRENGVNVPQILRVLEERRRIELGTCDDQSQVEPAV